MNHQMGGRNQKPKGVKVKHAIQVSILLVLGIWLLCQIKSSYFNPMEKKLKDGSVDLGRKSNAGLMNEAKPLMSIRNEEDGENGDDELDRKVEEEASQIEASVKEVLTREAKKEEELENKEKEILHKEEDRPSNSDDRNGEVESENDEKNHKEMTDEKAMGEDAATDDEEKDPKEVQSIVEVNTELQNSEEDEESNEKTEETESSDGGDSFNDQNGIPPDSVYLQDAAIKGITNDSVARRMDEETVLNSNNQTDHGTNTSTISQNKTEILEFGDSSGKSSENNSEVDTNDHEEAEEVLEAEEAEKLEQSRINGATELTQEDSLVLEGSDSVLSQHEVEERS